MRVRAVLVACLVAALCQQAQAARHWSAAQRLSDGASSLGLAAGAAGQGFLAWTVAERAGGSSAWVATRAPHRRFGPASPLTGASGWADDATVAADPKGDALVVWAGSPTTSDYSTPPDAQVWASYRPAGGAFAAPRAISQSPRGARPTSLTAAVDRTGTAFVAWVESTSGFPDQRIRITTRSAAGDWAPPQDLGSAGLGSRPQLASGGGVTVLDWSYESATPRYRDKLVASVRTGPAGFGPPAVVADTTAFGSSLSVDDGGAPALAWTQRDNRTDTEVYDALYRGGRWQRAVRLGATAADTGLGPAATATGPGTSAIAWMRPGTHRTVLHVFARRGSRSRLLRGAAHQNPGYSDGSLSDPIAAWTSAGRLITTWTTRDRNGDRPHASEGGLEGLGRPVALSPGFPVGNPDYQPRTALATDRAGGAIFAWRLSGGALEVATR